MEFSLYTFNPMFRQVRQVGVKLTQQRVGAHFTLRKI